MRGLSNVDLVATALGKSRSPSADQHEWEDKSRHAKSEVPVKLKVVVCTEGRHARMLACV